MEIYPSPTGTTTCSKCGIKIHLGEMRVTSGRLNKGRVYYITRVYYHAKCVLNMIKEANKEYGV